MCNGPKYKLPTRWDGAATVHESAVRETRDRSRDGTRIVCTDADDTMDLEGLVEPRAVGFQR